MSNSLTTKMERAKDAAALEHLDEELHRSESKRLQTAWMAIGAIHTTRKLTEAMKGEIVKVLAEFGEKELYKTVGYSTFAEFLDNSEYSPMSKSAFYERKQLLDAEGIETFDLLSALGLPVRKRRMLGRGSVQIEGDTVIVRDGDAESEIDLKDRSRLLETLSALADANAEKTKKLEKGADDFKKAKDKIRELQDAPAGGGKLSPGEQFAGGALTSMSGLCAWLESATLVEVESFIQRDLNLFAAQYRRLFAVIEQKGLEKSAVEVMNTDEENRLAALLDEEDD